MEKQQSNSLQNFDNSKTEILKKRLLKSANTSLSSSSTQSSSQHNVLLNNLRASTSSSMLVTSVSAPQSSMAISHSLVTHSIAPMKIHGNSSPYPLQLSTVHVPVQIPGSNSNINVPVQLSVPTTSVPLQIAPVNLPLQTPGTTNVPVQLPAGETINVPLQLPTASQNIQLTGPTLPSMPILQNSNQPLSSIIHVHMGSNTRSANIDASSEMSAANSSQIQINSATSVSQVSVGQSPAVVQIPNSSSNSIQLTLPTCGNSGTVQLRGAARPMPHVVYIQTPTGLKPVTSSDMISQASSSGNPPQIIVRRPVTNNSNIHLISNVSKPNIAPKLTASKSILAPANAAQPIVIQKPKSNEKMIVPVTIASGASGAPGAQAKQTIAYLSSVKKATTKTVPENQSILISNNQPNGNTNNQKLFLTPMMPKIQNTKFILPVTLPATMASKGPIINLQIANGQIQNDPQGNSITVMRDSGMETSEMPPLQPLAKIVSGNGKDNNNLTVHSQKSDKSFTVSIPGSRAEPTGEQGEYTLSIPETNASMNDDIYTVSIADGEGGQTREKSFTLAIPEKGKSLLNKNIFDKSEPPAPVAAPAILRRSFSDNSDRKAAQANLKRRISLCAENFTNKSYRIAVPQPLHDKSNDPSERESNDEHRVPSLFCDEKLEEAKANTGDSDADEFKDKSDLTQSTEHKEYYKKIDLFLKKDRHKLEDSPSTSLDEDPPGLIWSNGLATLRGSLLQFRTNEFGLIDIVDSNFEDFMPSTKYNTPLKQRIEMGSNRDKKPSSPEDMYQCDGCGCHGMAAEFITPNFCSLTCQADYQKTVQKRREKEKLELIKKRNKVRKLLMRKQLSDMDAFEDKPRDEKVPKHYESAPPAPPAPAESQAEPVKANDDFENEKYPWMCGKNGFSWMRYLDFCKAKAAPVKLFKDPFPYNRNNFKVGMRMEAIDPQHAAVFCVVSVAEVQGYRMRLHFDEYPDMYDYWVNADCPDLFPAGWCEKNGRSLRPPASYTPTNFSWPLYLKQMRAVAAPKQLFQHCSMQSIKPNGFRIGMKLEAMDRKNNLVCVATITDMLDNRMLINFDSWDEMYDYWVDPTSPHIHPVGWAEEQGVELTPPNYYKDPDSFSWEAYLEETGASAAPPRAFKTRPPQGFKPGMKLEVVDPRVPFLIRVATISAVRGHQVKVSFDGWSDALSAWLDDDSPDLHPVGWCLKTQHPLEPPLTEEERLVPGPCGVGGCRGLGSLRGGPHKQHPAASACPYRAPPPSPPDRLAPRHAAHQPERALVLPKRRVAAAAKPKLATASPPTSDSAKGKYVNPRGRPPKHKRVEEVVKNELSDDESVSSGGSKKWRGSGSQHSPPRDRDRHSPPRGRHSPPRDRSPEHKEESSLLPCAYGPAVAPPPAPAPLPAPRLQLHSYLQELDLPLDPTSWNQEDVATLVSRIAGAAAGSAALAARLSGAELVLASREELVSCARMRLGPAVKVYAAVCQLRQSLA